MLLSYNLTVKAGDRASVDFGAQSKTVTDQRSRPDQEAGGRSSALGIFGLLLLLGGVGLGYYAYRSSQPKSKLKGSPFRRDKHIHEADTAEVFGFSIFVSPRFLIPSGSHPLSPDQMHVQMEDRLPAIGAGVGDQPNPSFCNAFFVRQFARHGEDMSHQGFIFCFKRANRFDVFIRVRSGCGLAQPGGYRGMQSPVHRGTRPSLWLHSKRFCKKCSQRTSDRPSLKGGIRDK
jgi:hypothetical protein